eukprot:11209198-Ditylum_brightwellii.AAC.1
MFASRCRSSNRFCDAVPAVPGVVVAAWANGIAGVIGIAGMAGVTCIRVTSAPFTGASSYTISLLVMADVSFTPSFSSSLKEFFESSNVLISSSLARSK